MTDFRRMPSGTRWPVEGGTEPGAAAPSGPWIATQLQVVASAESRELVPLDVKAAGQPVTTGLQVSVTPTRDTRSWAPMEVHDGRTYLRLGGRPRGAHRVAVRHTSGAVVDAGRLVLT